MKTALTLTFLLVAPPQILAQAERSGSPPEVEGYRLGADWQKIGRLIPCRSGPDGLDVGQKAMADREYPRVLAELRICRPLGRVTLHFVRDTLFRIKVVFDGSTGPTLTWNQHRDWAVETLGMPDSVVTRSSESIALTWVTAHWDRPRAQWQAQLANYPNIAEFDMVYCGFLPSVCEAIFSPRPSQ